jgi:tRNA-specific 2-thiouridylase
LKKQGYEVVGVFMKNWSPGQDQVCTSEQDFNDVRQVCDQLGIPYYTFNFEKEYKKQVLDYFFAEYAKGCTPNPDIMCNREIKFGLFFDKAMKLGADLVATGHYAQLKIVGKQVKLLKGKDKKKDQTYFLYQVGLDKLAKTLFPVGGLPKSEVRRIADQYKLPNAKKPDSQGICFIGELDVTEFIKEKLPAKPGKTIDYLTGKVLGQHQGAHLCTIGQRHNLGVSGSSQPIYVVKTDIKTNTVWVAPNEYLFAKGAGMEDWYWLEQVKLPAKLTVKIRHSPEIYPGTLSEEAGKMKFVFNEPVRAITPGQSLVAYHGEQVVGGGVMDKQVESIR